MRLKYLVAACGAFVVGVNAAQAQTPAPAPADDPVRALVSRLDLVRYTATIKDLTQFGDRRQGRPMPRVPFRDSDGVTIRACRRKTPDRRIGNIQVQWTDMRS